MKNNYKATLLLLTGWSLFLLCLLLPALITEEKIYPGWYAGYLAFDAIFNFSPELGWLQYSTNGIGNLFSILVILSSGINNKKYLKINTILFSIFALMSLTYAFEYKSYQLGSGYYIWVIALFTIAYAHYFAYKKPNKLIKRDQ